MDIKYKRQLLAAGIDLNSTLERFMNNEDLYEKFLLKFLEDENFAELKENVKAKSYEKAFANAHTLKGVCANLGLDPLYSILVPMLNKIKENHYDEGVAEFKELEENYCEICNIIKENSTEN